MNNFVIEVVVIKDNNKTLIRRVPVTASTKEEAEKKAVESTSKKTGLPCALSLMNMLS